MVGPDSKESGRVQIQRGSGVAEILAQPLEARDKVQLLVERLARAVADGLLKPGECLPSERDFADELGVSRSVVREAFSALAATGLIARREGRGNFVAEVPDPGLLRERALSLLDSSPDPYDVCLAREALEPALASAVGMNATDEDFGKLASALNTLARACASRDWKAYFSADQQFHAALVASTHNRALVQAMEPLLNGMQAPIWTTLKQAYFLEHPANAEKSAQDHGQILAAVLERNASKLSESLRQHFLDVRSVLEYGISRGEPGQEVGAEGGAGESRVRTPT